MAKLATGVAAFTGASATSKAGYGLCDDENAVIIEVYAELKSTAHQNSHFVPAGIVAVNRAQERGYAIQHIG